MHFAPKYVKPLASERSLIPISLSQFILILSFTNIFISMEVKLKHFPSFDSHLQKGSILLFCNHFQYHFESTLKQKVVRNIELT